MHRTEGVDYTTEEGKRRYIDPNLPSVRGTVLNAESMNALQEEICNVVEKAGLTLNATAAADRAAEWDQLWEAITSSGIIGTQALSASAVTTPKLADGAVTGPKAVSSTNQTALYAGGYDNGVAGVARAGFHTGESTASTGIHSVGRPHTTGNTLPRPNTAPNGATKYADKYYMQGLVLSAYHSAYLEASEIDGTYVQDDIEVFIGLSVYDGLDMSGYERCYHVWHRSKHVTNGTPDQLSWVCVQANDAAGHDLLKYKTTSRINGNDGDGVMSVTLNGAEDVVLITNWYDAGGGSYVNDVASCEVILDADMPFGKTAHIALYSKCRSGSTSAQLKITGQTDTVYSPQNWHEFDGYGVTSYWENLVGLATGDAFVIECDVTRVHDTYPVPGYLVTNFTKRKI